jgi:hypothetical protein
MCRTAAFALTVAGVLLGVVACGGSGDDGGDATPVTDTQPAATTGTETPDPIAIKLREVNDSGQSGTATLIPGKVGKIETFDVRLEIEPAIELPQMAHVHRVTCAGYAEVKGIDAQIATVHSPLADVRDGKSESKNVSASIGTGQFSINVHEPAHPFPAVACADIPRHGQ